jgi:hypothetical protein
MKRLAPMIDQGPSAQRQLDIDNSDLRLHRNIVKFLKIAAPRS